MAMKTREELEALLAEQIEHLEASAELYDKGRRHEAKRLATSVRVLLHDTSMSRSLLRLLELKDKLLFLDTAGPVNKKNLMFLTPLLINQIQITENGAVGSYLPVFYDGPRPGPDYRALPFDEWWTMMVLRDSNYIEFSRKDLVLYLANKAGGAHVDEETKEKFRALAANESIGWIVGDANGERPIEEDPILPCVRQIAFELLEVLRVRQMIPVEERPSGTEHALAPPTATPAP